MEGELRQCKNCHKGFIQDPTFLGVRIYCSKDCEKTYKTKRKNLMKRGIKALNKLSQNEKRVIQYINSYIPHPEEITETQLREICSSYGAKYGKVKAKLKYEEFITCDEVRFDRRVLI